jgi:hypothetical protein
MKIKTLLSAGLAAAALLLPGPAKAQLAVVDASSIAKILI